MKRKRPIWVHPMNLREQEPELQVVAFHPIPPVAIDAEIEGPNFLGLIVLND